MEKIDLRLQFVVIDRSEVGFPTFAWMSGLCPTTGGKIKELVCHTASEVDGTITLNPLLCRAARCV